MLRFVNMFYITIIRLFLSVTFQHEEDFHNQSYTGTYA